MAVRAHLVEHRSMAPDGLSARTNVLAPLLVTDVRFHDDSTLIGALSSVEGDFSVYPDDTHVVVICTHGVEDTGTWLHTDDGLAKQRPTALNHHLLRSYPPHVLVYTAVCWGGYPGLVRRFQHGTKPSPVFVGALAPLTADEGNELQDQLVSTVAIRGLSESDLSQVVDAFNRKYLDEYGHVPARFVSSDGVFTPPQGTAGISWCLLRDASEAPFLGPYEVVGLDSTRDSARVAYQATGSATSAAIKCGSLRVAKGGAPAVGDRFSFYGKLSPCSRYLQAVGDVQVL